MAMPVSERLFRFSFEENFNVIEKNYANGAVSINF